MNHTPDQIIFTGRKPSAAQIVAKAAAIASRSSFIEVLWGENWLQLDRYGDRWAGHGWIKDISADSIAAELNKRNARAQLAEFISEHFIVRHIGA